jgi:transposase-like protein
LSLLSGDRYCKEWKTPQGKQRYQCREKPCDGRTFILNYSYPGQSRKVKEQIVDMAFNGSGIRDTARVLHVSTSTVIKEIKKETATATSESSSIKATKFRDQSQLIFVWLD